MVERHLWQVSSRYALVTCMINGNNECVVEKNILPNLNNGFNVDFINDTSMYFREELKKLRVPLAEPYLCLKRDGRSIQISPYVGEDLEKIFKSGKAKIQLIEGILTGIEGVLMQEDPVVGIDARVSNFCLGVDGVVYYVDTFPALVKYQSNYLVHYPNPIDPKILNQEYYRKFTKRGILRRLRFSILEQDSGFYEKDLLASIKSVLGQNFFQEMVEFFNSLPDHIEDKQLALDTMSLDDPDGIRELALRFKPPKGGGRTEYFNEVFDLSSNFCPYDLSESERLNRIRDLFLKH